MTEKQAILQEELKTQTKELENYFIENIKETLEDKEVTENIELSKTRGLWDRYSEVIKEYNYSKNDLDQIQEKIITLKEISRQKQEPKYLIRTGIRFSKNGEYEVLWVDMSKNIGCIYKTDVDKIEEIDKKKAEKLEQMFSEKEIQNKVHRFLTSKEYIKKAYNVAETYEKLNRKVK